MKKENIMIPLESEQLAALDFSLKKKNTSVQAQMEKTLRALYETEVPEPLREYLDSKAVPASKPKRLSLIHILRFSVAMCGKMGLVASTTR